MNKSVMKFIKTVKRGLGKRSPEILLGIGIASGITATVLAVKATPKALELLTEKRYEKYGDTLKEDDSYDDMPELKPVEVVKATWKCYIPAAISGNSRRSVRASYDFDDVVFDTRGEADEVLSSMDELMDRYGVVSVADMYDLCGMTCNYTDNKYGWKSLARADISRVRDGYMIKLPKAEPI